MTVFEATFVFAIIALAALAWSLRRRLHSANADHARELVEARTRHEAAMHHETNRVSALFDRMLDGVIMVGADGLIRFANRAAGEFFDNKKPMSGRTVLEATMRHEVAALLHGVGQKSESLDHELRLEHAGKVRTLQMNALGLTATDGRREGTLLIFHDVTRLRQLESVRQDFVANVSHELRTPLSLIKSAAETLIDGGKTDPRVTDRFLDIIDQNASRLTLLIDDLLLLARLDSGRLEMQFQSMPVRDAAQSALDDAALLARARAVNLQNDVGSDIRAIADPDRLRQVLANLIDNAIKYGRTEGCVVITSRVLSPQYVEVGVHDDGPGIPVEARARIFERFYRVDKARAREQGGTGLGLAIVKNVVEAHGGNIRVESAADKGTTFFFTLRNGASA
jgi:two-component system, OmpR family, phosphate regulon sensor histidine kinase PhoR